MKPQQILKSESGIITLDYIFALVLVFGFTSILLALSLTLTVVEITQYMTFATARTYMASHISAKHQEELARLKYNQLISNEVLAPLFTNGWFQVNTDPIIGDMSDTIPEYKGNNAAGANLFWGAGTPFVARMLDIRIPFFGSTTNEKTNADAGGFSTFIGSYLSRESTEAECINFNNNRWRAIRNLSVQGAAGYNQHTSEDGVYHTFADNGC